MLIHLLGMLCSQKHRFPCTHQNSCEPEDRKKAEIALLFTSIPELEKGINEAYIQLLLPPYPPHILLIPGSAQFLGRTVASAIIFKSRVLDGFEGLFPWGVRMGFHTGCYGWKGIWGWNGIKREEKREEREKSEAHAKKVWYIY